MPRRTASEVSLDDRSLYLNRELGLLAFQKRVLEEVEDPNNPLLERAKFLAILSSNVAEFYMVRVAGLQQQLDAGVGELSDDGMTVSEQLTTVREACEALLGQAREAYHVLKRDLDDAGIKLLDFADLDDEARAAADAFFAEKVFPVLTPLASDPGRPFPHISNLSLNLAVVIRGDDGIERFARVKIPRTLPRLVPLGVSRSCDRRSRAMQRQHCFVWLEQLVAANLSALFPGMTVVASYPFRITRDAEMAIQDLEADDLLETIEEGVRRRRFGSVVRMTHEPDMPAHIKRILMDNVDVDPADVVQLQPPLGMSDIMKLYSIDRPELKFKPFAPRVPLDVDDTADQDVFAAIRERDILLHHPFDSFEPIVSLLRQAAADPDVLAIKMSLYRVGRRSPIVQALMDAAIAGKEVAVLVELKARFDEESNIEWARALEREGVHVVYGLVGLKTHSKVALIVRREGDTIRRYVHVGTGNYNAVTTREYTDIGMLTCDPVMGADASQLFNYITGYAPKAKYKRFLVAPVELRGGLERMVRAEMEHAKAGRPARLIFKMNSLVDRRMIRLLYEAALAGVEMDLIVRGICCLRPGVPGVTENVRVRSIVGRFLEHSRIFYFENGGQPKMLIGSADLMVRNLDRRVEVLAPVSDPVLARRLHDEILTAYLADNVKARRMLSDGSYERVDPDNGERPFNAQEAFIVAQARGKRRGGAGSKRRAKSKSRATGSGGSK